MTPEAVPSYQEARDEALTLIDEIQSARGDLYEAKRGIAAVDEELQGIKDVAIVAGVEGKNSDVREAALRIAMRENEEYGRLLFHRSELQSSQQMAQMALDYSESLLRVRIRDMDYATLTLHEQRETNEVGAHFKPRADWFEGISR